MGILKHSINKKLIFLLAIIFIASLLSVSLIIYHAGRKAIINNTIDHQKIIRNIQKRHIENHFKQIMSEAKIVSSSFNIANVLSDLDAEKPGHSISVHYSQLEYFTKKNQCKTVYIKLSNNTSIYKANPYKDQISLVKLSNQELELPFFSQDTISDVSISDIKTQTKDNLYSFFILAPITKENHKHIGSIAFEFQHSSIDKIISNNNGYNLDETTTTYLIDAEGLIRSSCKPFSKTRMHAQIDNSKTVTQQDEPCIVSHNNIKTFRVHAPLQIDGLNWHILVDISYNDALAKLSNSRNFIIPILLTLTLFVIITVFLIYRIVTVPITKLASIMNSTSAFSIPPIATKRKDEIGMLYNSFNELSKNIIQQQKDLFKNEEMFNLFFDSTTDGILFHEDQKVVLANSSLAKITGFSTDELMGLNAQSLYISKMINESNKAVLYESKAFRKNKPPINAEIQHNFIEHKDKKINICLIRDITEKVKARESSQKSEEQLYAVFNYSPLMNFLINKNNRLLTMNKTAQEAAQKNIHKYIGNILGCISALESKTNCGKSPNCKKCKIHDAIKYTFKTKKVLKNVEATITNYTEQKKNITYYKISTVYLSSLDEPILMLSAEDITSKKHHERKLLAATIQVEEKERKRLAQDLHDELGPFLSGIKLYIGKLGDNNIDKPYKEKLINEVEELIDDAISKTRNISNKLMPSTIEDFGLTGALESFFSKINAVKEIKISFLLHENINILSNNLQIVFYRIIIELINNTIKHANAQFIHIDMHIEDNEIKITYSDDGIGFDFEEVQKKKKGLGLLNIINRLINIDATYKIETRPQHGFKFIIKAPFI